MKDRFSSHHGVLIVNKPPGPSSHDMVYRLRSLLGIQKIGHAGTLDPFASGVLVMGVGQGTKILEYMQHQKKTYRMVLRLGLITDTYDCNGQVVEEKEVRFSPEAIREAASAFVGGYAQVPPVYSAKKVQGQRLYDLARKGKIIRMPPKNVEIDRIDVLSIQGADVTLEVVAGEGTYMRSLAMDIGYRLGTGATALSLVRLKSGAFTIEGALELWEQSSKELLIQSLLPIETALSDFKRIYLSEADVLKVRNGNQVYAFFPTTGPAGMYSDLSFEKDELLLACEQTGKPVAVLRAEVNGSFAASLANRSLNRRIATLVKVFGVM